MNTLSLPTAFPPAPAMPPAISPGQPLHALLDESLEHPPEFGEGLSSHLPMALAALQALGANAAQMRRFADTYLQRSGLAARRAQRLTPAVLADWTALRGQVEAFPVLRAHFSAVLLRDGREATLREALPQLLTGLSGALFHGLIRTAHALESGHTGELAAALAYWAARWRGLPPGDATSPPLDGVSTWLQALEAALQELDPAGRSSAGTISGRMADAVQTAPYRQLAIGPCLRQPLAASLFTLADDAARRYLQSGNFTVLHMATAMRAALVLASGCPVAAQPGWLPALWRASLAARMASAVAPSAAVAAPGVADAAPAAAPPGLYAEAWAQVRAAACESRDDHTIKLVHAMDWLAHHELQATRQGGEGAAWLAAAQRAVEADRSGRV